jgi:hypothetical protein
VLVMAVDHFGGPVTRFTFQPFGFASAAEGFVFLAGLVSGLVYTRFLEAPGHTLERRAFARAGKVYKYHVAAVVLLLAIGLCSKGYADYYARRELASHSPLATLGYALLLVNQPRLLDVLPMYVVFFLALPIALRQFAAGRARLVLAVSGGLWLATQLSAPPLLPAAYGLPSGVMLTDFDYRAWQMLFVAGLWCGWRRAVGRPLQPSRALERWALAIALPLLLLRHFGPPPQALLLDAALERAWLAWLRMLDVMALVVLARAALRRCGRLVGQPWLVDVGRQSLPIFVVHGIALYLLDPLRWRITDLGWIAETAGALLFAAALVGFARWRCNRERRAAAAAAD